ncbi:hypothetical protein DFQ28_009908 [Apophysomyces sp. BC1034]|nr:hypothetical protein DFQ30_009556 [Apophysomyces sp. BC1015]KAG0172102.1 hypothetical protein DFQ29_008527 [Apophysomyces sp. BC1021]KAG0185127.1 hypothetical protein DFQ28_009908 [Apophysomyces sp. BC1034]
MEKESRKKRHVWTVEETEHLIHGCFEYGVGNWKNILRDPKYTFDQRTAVDLKDRFRTVFPAKYKQLYPTTQCAATDPSKGPTFQRVQRRQRRPFNAQEDSALLKGVEIYGVSWTKMTKDPELNLSHRKSRDLRDRFRNAFPDQYEELGYTPRLTKKQRITKYTDES